MNLSDLDIPAIRRALDDHDPDREHFLDLREGSVWTFVFSEATDETHAQHARVTSAADGYVRIPSISPQDAFEEIEDFVEEVADAKLRESLFRALERRGAFRNFREALLAHPEEHRRWRTRRRESAAQRLDAFLTTLGIDGCDLPVEPVG